MNVAEWVKSAPPGMLVWFDSIAFRRFVAEQRQASFQLPGSMDGAMSEDCKQLFREQYDALSEFQVALRSNL